MPPCITLFLCVFSCCLLLFWFVDIVILLCLLGLHLFQISSFFLIVFCDLHCRMLILSLLIVRKLSGFVFLFFLGMLRVLYTLVVLLRILYLLKILVMLCLFCGLCFHLVVSLAYYLVLFLVVYILVMFWLLVLNCQSLGILVSFLGSIFVLEHFG